jgi:uncharacterized membrane protein
MDWTESVLQYTLMLILAVIMVIYEVLAFIGWFMTIHPALTLMIVVLILIGIMEKGGK